MRRKIVLFTGIVFLYVFSFSQNGAAEKISFMQYDVGVFDGASDIWAVDINHDGFTDLIATSYYDGICWWENDGQQNFSKHRIADAIDQPGARSLRATLHDGSIVDFNGDGFVDFVSAAMDNNQVALWLNDSIGNFSKIIIDTLLYGAHTVDIIDLDSNGNLDILICGMGSPTQNGEFSIYYNSGNLQFTKQMLHNTSLAMPTFIHSGDIDNDGDLDILFTEYHWSNPSDMGWYRNDDTGFVKIPIAQYKGFHTGLLKDFDKDGDLDILAAAYNGSKFFLYFNNGSGSFTKTWEATGAGAIWLDMADFDNDSINDLVGAAQNSISYPDLYWFSNNGQNVFTPYTLNSGLKEVHCVTTNDIDKDGDQDIIIVANGSDKVIWYENDCINSLLNAGISNNDNTFFVFPNPVLTEAIISFKLNEKENVILTICNLNGIEIQTVIDSKLQAGVHQFTIKSDNFKPGVYLVKLYIGQYYYIKKIII